MRVLLLLLALAVATSPMVEEEDDDEFIRTEPKVTQPEPVKAAPAAPRAKKETWLQKWIWEILIIVCTSLFAANFLRGQMANKQRALQWLGLVRPFLQEQFSRVQVLSRISPQEYRLYCTGRINCYAAETTLHLQPQQDLSAMVLGMFTRTTEHFIIEVPMTEKMQPFIFALFARNKEKKMREDFSDLAMTKRRAFSQSNLMLCTDSGEAQKLLTNDLLTQMAPVAHLVRLIYCTDSFSMYETDYKQMARFQFVLPRHARDFELVTKCFKLAMRFVDAFANLSLTKMALEKAKAVRKKANTEKQKETRAELEEKAEQRKLAKLQAERDNLKKLTGKEKAKAEEKIRKRELKEQQKRLKGRSIVIK